MTLPIQVASGLARNASFKRHHVQARTANYTPALNNTGGTITNRGATGAITITLPTDKAKGLTGLLYRVTVEAAQTVTVSPGAAGTIRIEGEKLATAATVGSAVVGESILFESDGNSGWTVIERVGNWSGGGKSTTAGGGTLAIPTTARYVSKTTSGTEALTLANGIPGQLLTITLDTDGGTGTLTPATSTGFATIVFADAGDQATLQYHDSTVGWTTVGLVGVAAPPAITV